MLYAYIGMLYAYIGHLYAYIGASQARVLERRAEVMSGDFNSQEVANTLCAFATMGTKPGQLERRYQGSSTLTFDAHDSGKYCGKL
jgi:hypothetical protein